MAEVQRLRWSSKPVITGYGFTENRKTGLTTFTITRSGYAATGLLFFENGPEFTPRVQVMNIYPLLSPSQEKRANKICDCLRARL